MLSTEIVRDGGSLAADFERPDGSQLYVFLRIAARSPSGGPRLFRHLHMGSPPPRWDLSEKTLVVKKSPEERDILDDLDRWLDGAEEAGEDGERIAFIRDLRLQIAERLD